MDNPPVSFKRYALLHGWARLLSLSLERSKHLDTLIKIRGTNFGIAVGQDRWALEYQRLDFRLRRARYAIGVYGILDCKTAAGKFGQMTKSRRRTVGHSTT